MTKCELDDATVHWAGRFAVDHIQYPVRLPAPYQRRPSHNAIMLFCMALGMRCHRRLPGCGRSRQGARHRDPQRSVGGTMLLLRAACRPRFRPPGQVETRTEAPAAHPATPVANASTPSRSRSRRRRGLARLGRRSASAHRHPRSRCASMLMRSGVARFVTWRGPGRLSTSSPAAQLKSSLSTPAAKCP